MRKCKRDQEKSHKNENKIETAKSGAAACQYEWNYSNHLDELEAKDKISTNFHKTRLQRIVQN